ncbi:MAG: hypothetical protein MI749_20755 [Desulfovibrionales bacterium]|nr:hypothetical protein [Desulfovibrionales bacterium]
MNHSPKKTLKMVLVGLFLLLSSGIAFAGCGMPGSHKMNPQYKGMEKFCQDHYDRMRPLHREFQSQRALMKSEMLKEKVDVTKVKAIQAGLSDLRSRIEALELEHRLEMKKLGMDPGGYCKNAGSPCGGHRGKMHRGYCQ